MRTLRVGLLISLVATAGWVVLRTPAPASNSDVVTLAAQGFLASLDTEQRALATYAMDHDERLNWHFVPRERNGLPLGSMTLEQRTLAHRLLRTTMSAQGYLKANAIIELERVLGMLENRPDRRDPENYFVTVFGSPSNDSAWAWRFEGHHLALNFTSVTGELVVTGPAFMGANPATVPSGPKAGWRVLGDEETAARSLVTMLTPAQRRSAVISEEAPRDIITGADRSVSLERREGIRASDLTAEQRYALTQLISVYVHNMDAESARAWMGKVADIPLTDLWFAWAGPVDPGQGHYYRVHGPTFLIEYDNTQSNVNHVHSVWRDLANDFGGDALAEHYRESDHGH